MKLTPFKRLLGFVASCAILAGVASTQTRAVNIDIYSGFDPSGDGSPFSGLIGSTTSPDIDFPDTFVLVPPGTGAFGLQITGCLVVDATGVYSFDLLSDDGSSLSIDGILVIDNGGAHGPSSVAGIAALTPGVHSFTVNYYEDFGPPGVLVLTLPAGVSYGDCGRVPDGGATAMLAGLSLAGLALMRRNRR